MIDTYTCEMMVMSQNVARLSLGLHCYCQEHTSSLGNAHLNIHLCKFLGQVLPFVVSFTSLNPEYQVQRVAHCKILLLKRRNIQYSYLMNSLRFFLLVYFCIAYLIFVIFYTGTILDHEILHLKVRKFATKAVTRQNCV